MRTRQEQRDHDKAVAIVLEEKAKHADPLDFYDSALGRLVEEFKITYNEAAALLERLST